MVSEYRFLRFEIVGLATIFFYVIVLMPVAASLMRATLRDLGTSVAIVSSLFLVSLPLGYWEHQLVVNAYRSEKKTRKAHELLGKMITDAFPTRAQKSPISSLDQADQSSLLTALMELCIYAKNAHIESEIFERLGDRWSHFYARKAISLYAPVISAIMWAFTLLFGHFLSWSLEYSNTYLSLIMLLLLSGINLKFIHPYSHKIWLEINYLEAGIVLANQDVFISILSSVVGEFANKQEQK